MQFKYCISVFILLLFLCKLYNSPDENSTNDYPTTLLCYLLPSKFTAYQNIYFTLLFPLQVTPRLEKKKTIRMTVLQPLLYVVFMYVVLLRILVCL